MSQYLDAFIEKALEAELLDPADTVYAYNQLLSLLQLPQAPAQKPSSESLPDLLDHLVQYAIEEKMIEDMLDEKEIFAAKIMNVCMPRPSTVQTVFQENYQQAPEAATNYFYQLSRNSNYIQTNRIKKNISFKATTDYGELDITINLSKPEKDPEQIKRERAMKQEASYPACVLCKENEGYAGRIGYPARSNHRIVKLPLEGENWYLQYSPYVYYNEHSILLSEEHRPMKISKETFRHLLAFTDKFPHYFIGSNADLPIVGGSILSHDHYQAGNYEFAMTKAKDAFTFPLKAFPDIHAAVLQWPMSVIRLQGEAIEQLTEAGDFILQHWQDYTDKEASVLAYTDETPHNTITPIARNRGEFFELDLVLRNNRTTAEHPYGLFHPHEDVHHIKKENIGLIEVMGLAVLPPRLKDELDAIKSYLAGGLTIEKIEPYHQQWAKELYQRHGKASSETQAEQLLQTALGDKFAKVLADAGVFKTKAAFEAFIQLLNR